jgi:hypothetical protein
VTTRPGLPAWPASPARKLLRPAVAAATLLLVLLPALVVSQHLGAPPHPGERERIVRAIAAAPSERVVDGEVARSFYRSALRSVSIDASDAASPWLPRARLAQVLGVFGLTGLLYTAVLLAGDRLRALLACAWLTALPPVLTEGHVLRAETPAALFGWLGLAVLLGLVPSARRGRGALGRGFFIGGCALTANGLAVAALPTFGVALLAPGVVLTLAALQLLARSVRIVRRRGIGRLPYAACNRRLLPWTALSLATPLVALGTMLVAAPGPVPEGADGSAWLAAGSDIGLLPAAAPWRTLLWALLVLGALGGVFRIGTEFGRRGRVTATVVLWVGVALMLAGARQSPPVDALPAAPAAAVVLGEGTLWAVFLLRRLGLRLLGGKMPATRLDSAR